VKIIESQGKGWLLKKNNNSEPSSDINTQKISSKLIGRKVKDCCVCTRAANMERNEILNNVRKI
jgi:hypothetical protein